MNTYAKRQRDFAYLAWVTAQQCIVCEKAHAPQLTRTYAHHAGARGLSQRASDHTAIPLCWRHHDRGSSLSIHALGKKFWVVYALDRGVVIAELRERYLLETEGWRMAA
jgi:hypothetical protein